MNFACRLPSGQQTFSLILILSAYQFLEDGHWSMPVHHKASTMWAQAVGKKNIYIYITAISGLFMCCHVSVHVWGHVAGHVKDSCGVL